MDKTDRGAAFDEAIATLNDGTAALGGTVFEVFVHDTLDEAVAQLQKSGMTRSAAMSAAARAHPQLVEKYNREGEDRVSKAAEASKPRAVNKAAVLAFEDRVDEIAKRHGLPRSRAMSKARERFPDEFRAYQEA